MIKCHTSSAALGIYSANEVSIIINSVSLLYSAIFCSLYVVRASFEAQLVESPPCNAGDLGSILGGEDPLENGKATAPEYWPREFQRCCKELDTTE